jgi:hypothetical protein
MFSQVRRGLVFEDSRPLFLLQVALFSNSNHHCCILARAHTPTLLQRTANAKHHNTVMSGTRTI